MCTLVLLRRPGEPWPLICAANRDEMAGRPWRPPGRHWPERPDVRAGLDELAGGSWMGLNDHGVMAAILNRVGSLGPAAGKRSRGELVLEALDHADAALAARALADLDPRAYRSFNLVVADGRDAFWLRNRGDPGSAGGCAEARPGSERVELFTLPPGLSMITAHDRNDRSSGRTRSYLPRFESAAPPDPDAGDWRAWQALMASRLSDADEGPYGAMTVAGEDGFGTVSSSLVALPAPGAERPVWLFAPGPPDRSDYAPVEP